MPMAAAQSDTPDKVRMAYMEYAPYSFTDVNGVPRGLTIDLAQRLIGALGQELELISVANPTEMMEMVASGAVDMTGVLAPTEERLQIAPMTKPVGSFRTSLFVRRGSDVTDGTDIGGLRIGVLEGSVTLNAAKNITPEQVFFYPTSDARILALLKGEIDASLSTLNGLSATLRAMGLDVLIEPLEPPLAQTFFGFYVSKQMPELLSALDREISENLTLSEIRTLNETWFGTPTRLREHVVIFWGSIVTFVLLVTAICGLIGWHVHRLRARLLLQETAQYGLITDALDRMGAAIVIFDEKFEATHWNKGFTNILPGMSETLKSGVGLHEMIVTSYNNGTILSEMNTAQVHDVADGVIENLRTGRVSNRLVHTVGGRVLDATDFSIGPDHYASVRVDVTKIHRQAETILEQKAELLVANEQLKLFSTIAAHDLKAPLGQQRNLIEFIEEDLAEAGVMLPDEVQQYFSLLKGSSKKMQNLVNDLLEHAQATKVERELENVLPSLRMAEVVALTGLPANFTVEVAPDMPAVYVDVTSFDTVMRNLISNAIKHHDKDTGLIKISGHEANGEITLRIEDDGPGIPEKYRTTIFEPFKRLSANVDGTGLGLSFVHKTVSEWGGSIAVECLHARGSTFVITMPAKAVTKLPEHSDRGSPAAAA